MALGLQIPSSASALGADLSANSVLDMQARMRETQRKSEEYTRQAEEAGIKEATLREAKSADYDPVIQKLKTRMTEEQQRPVEPLTEVPEFKQKQITPDELKDAFSTFMVFAMLGGALTKQPMLAAMGNMTAAMQGWMAGDAKVAKANLEEFDRNFKVASAKRANQIEERNAAHQKYKGDIEMLMLEEKQIALKYEDQIGAELARKQDLNGLAKHYDTLARNYETSINHAKQAELQLQRLEAQERRQDQRHAEVLASLKEKQREFDKRESDKQVPSAKAMSPAGKQAVDEGLKPGTPAFLERVKAINDTKSQGKIGSREITAANILVGAANQAMVGIEALGNLSSGKPLYANKLADVKDNPSVIAAIAGYVSRKMSTTEQQEYTKLVDSLVGDITRLYGASGYASDTNQANMERIKRVIQAKEGLTPATAYQSIAEIGQIYIAALEAVKLQRAMNPEQKKLLETNERKVAQLIPYSVSDVIDYGRDMEGRKPADYMTMPEWMKSKGRQGQTFEKVMNQSREKAPTDAVDLREAAQNKINAGADPVLVKKRYKELTGQDF